MNVSDLAESDLVARIQSRLPNPPSWVVVGIGDDAAVVEPARQRLEILTVDAVIDGVHFDRRFTPPDAIGHRALAVNLSDLAAMGAEPRLALLSMALPADLPAADLEGLVDGLARLASVHRLHIVGGNLTRTPGPLMIDVTVIGTAKRRQIMTRSGARPGDELWVTGSLGAAAAGLEMLKAGRPGDPECIRRFLYPEPRVRTGLLLARNRAASACIDLSDGLGDGVRRIAEQSGVGVVVDASALPVEREARRWLEGHTADAVTAAIERGDDYELLIAVRPRHRGRLEAALSNPSVPLTRIGHCTAERPVVLKRDTGVLEPLPHGFSHFHRGHTAQPLL